MNRLGNSRAGRVLLHLLCMVRDHELTFHAAGIRRELWRAA